MIKEIVSDVMNFRFFLTFNISHIGWDKECTRALFLSDDSFFLPKKINHVTFSPRSGLREEGVPGSGWWVPRGSEEAAQL